MTDTRNAIVKPRIQIDTAISSVAGLTFALTVSKSGSGAGTVTSSPAGINCGATCSASYGGAIVNLTATPAAGSKFAGWSGGGCSGTGSCALIMSSAKSVAATFSRGAIAPILMLLLD